MIENAKANDMIPVEDVYGLGNKVASEKENLFEELHNLRRLDKVGIIDPLTSVREQAKIFRKMGFQV